MSENVSSQEVNKQTRWWENTPGLAECFLELCLAEIGKEGLSGASLKSTSWKNISVGIKDAYGIKVEQRALKNRFDLEKKRFNIWKDITRGTGGGINNSTGEINWDDHTWAQAIRKNPKAKTFRGNPLKNCELLHKIFQGVTASGQNRYATAQDEMPNEVNGILEIVDEVQESPNDTIHVEDPYWEDLSFDGERPHTPSQPQTQPVNGNISTVPSASSGSKKRKKMHDHDADLAKVVTLLEGQMELMKEEKQIEHAKEIAQKLEEESYSVSECNAVLTVMKNLDLITEVECCKAMVQLAKMKEFRKALMAMENIEDKKLFVKGLGM